ncbi:SNARE-complex protein Syntaxin-18 like protein [Nannochloropsis gaditana]|uniref:SNARE-complex protein Syntaxin-18 like protein n=1 Tax=Nannochloropsis gaditana TaxID=72520 RepID=W7TMC8_9STRA|nr:SNARE-complex protein Syntaxin-18 like protein [Nannochloropsis gaditana]
MDVTDAWLAAVASARWTTKAASPGFPSSTCVKSRTAFATASTSTFPNKSADATHGIITDPFTQQAREVLDSIRTKEEILKKNRGRYVDPYRYVPSRAANMTDLERDQIDQVMASFIIKCGSQIEILRCALAEASSLEAGGGNADLVGGEGSRLAHHGKVVAYLAERLQDLGNTLQNLQARRRHLNGLVPSSSGADAGQACRPGSTTRTLTTPSWNSFAKAGGSHKAKGRPIMAPNKVGSAFVRF